MPRKVNNRVASESADSGESFGNRIEVRGHVLIDPRGGRHEVSRRIG